MAEHSERGENSIFRTRHQWRKISPRPRNLRNISELSITALAQFSAIRGSLTCMVQAPFLCRVVVVGYENDSFHSIFPHLKRQRNLEEGCSLGAEMSLF